MTFIDTESRVSGSVGISNIPLSVEGTQFIHGSVGITEGGGRGTIATVQSGSVGILEQPIGIHGSVGVSEGGGRGTIATVQSGSVGILEQPSATTGTYGGVKISSVATLIAASNPDRKYAIIRNMSGTRIYIGFDSLITASLGSADSGLPLEDGEAFEVTQINLYKGDIYGITGGGTAEVNKLLW